MLRIRLVLALVLFAGLGATAPTAEPALDGNWKLSFVLTPELESTLCVLRLETKDGALTARVVGVAPHKWATTVERVSRDGANLRLVLQGAAGAQTFEGRLSPTQSQVLLGSCSSEHRLHVARLTRTDKTELAPTGLITRLAPPVPLRQLKTLTDRLDDLRVQQRQAITAAAKAKLTEQVTAAERAAQAEAPKLYEEVLARHADSSALFETALRLLGTARRLQATPEQVASWAKALARAAELYGQRWRQEIALRIAEVLDSQPGCGAVALEHAQWMAKQLTEQEPIARQVRILQALAAAEQRTGRAAEARQTTTRLAKLEALLDTEYHVQFPPLKVTPFAGREGKNGRVVVLELFTGSHCPYSPATTLVFDGLRRSYSPRDLVLIQYHLDLMGPTPLANADAEQRWAFFTRAFPKEVRVTPSILVNGQLQSIGGHVNHGNKTLDLHRDAKKKYNLLSEALDRLAEAPAGARITARVERQGSKVSVRATVSDLASPNESKRLRLVLVEETVRHVGGNNLRFHHHVARAMPGGPEGVALTAKDSEHRVTVDLDELRERTRRYLDDYADRVRPFPSVDRPLDLTKLRVIAFVQDDQTREILQGCLAEVPSELEK